MNSVERIVYRAVRDNPHLKRFVRDAYQRLWDLVPGPAVETTHSITERPGCFFGFHDKSPFSGDDSKLLAHKELIPLRMPRSDDAAEIGYFDGEHWSDYHPVAKTTAWNWHQGAMLQWIGRSPFFVFNDCLRNSHVARVFSTQGGCEQVVPAPVGAVSPDGETALSYSFVRSGLGMAGYGYANGVDPTAEENVPESDGLYKIDLKTGRKELLFSIAEIVRKYPEDAMAGRYHWFTHCLFSPSGRRFTFLHRWVDRADGSRWTRMFSCGSDGGSLHLFPTTRMVSHVSWRGDGYVAAYARTRGADDAYHLFTDGCSEFSVIGGSLFTSDGHPSFSADGRWMVTDTYPDARRRQRLILYDMEKRVRYDVASFRIPRKFAGKSLTDHWSVDLHPRWSRDCRTLCFDCGASGTRSLCTIELGEVDPECGPAAIRATRDQEMRSEVAGC